MDLQDPVKVAAVVLDGVRDSGHVGADVKRAGLGPGHGLTPETFELREHEHIRTLRKLRLDGAEDVDADLDG